MRFNRSALYLSIIFLLSLTGCDMIKQGGSPTDSAYLPQDSPALSNNAMSSGQDEWPDYIPDAIPVLEGEISNIMIAPESHIRIFYENVTDRQIENYLSLLQEQGFEFTYIVYQQEGFPDNSEERLAEGDYDAVDITKGEYHMNLSSGAGTAVYDIYTAGFEELVTQAMESQWTEELEDTLPTPAEWPSIFESNLPQPENCALVKNRTAGPNTVYADCVPENDDVLVNYAAALEAIGFEETQRLLNSDNQPYLIVLTRDQDMATLTLDSPTLVSITIYLSD